MRKSALSLWLSPAIAAMVMQPALARACATCFGAPDAAMTKGLNAGILVLLLVVLMVLGGAAAFFIYLARRAASVQDHSLVEESMGDAAGKIH